jgi:hypothetical protein
MLGNCILRNPTMKDGTFDKGALCESLLFFGKAHLLIDLATLATMARANFLDDLIAMLKAGYLTGNYSPQACRFAYRQHEWPARALFCCDQTQWESA